MRASAWACRDIACSISIWTAFARITRARSAITCSGRALTCRNVRCRPRNNLTREDGWPFETLDDYIETHKAAEREHLYATMKPLPGVAQALQRLANEHVYIRIVTHRLFVSGQHQMVVSDTAQWLDSNRIPYMSLCFTGLKDSMQATIHIDDSPANIETLREAGQHVVVFDQPYNSTYAGPRIDSWSDTNVETLLTLFESWPE